MKLKQITSTLVLMLGAPLLVLSQPLPPDPGTSPDVPFDSSMNIIFMVAGVVFAGLIVYKEIKSRRKLAGK